MSVMFVEKECIDLILSGMVTHDVYYGGSPVRERKLDVVGKALWHTNYISFARRYPHEKSTVEALRAQVERYEFKKYDYIDPLALIKQVHCYMYQCSELRSWKTHALRESCFDLIMRCVEQFPGYNSLPWSILNPEDIEAVTSRGN